ncbi:hypothetical protein BDQ17DRAFT_1322667 [Cyathus striatus]|nr:hypothetical protein BDQ17DRAFT_1322667 [Cyathus striatus]
MDALPRPLSPVNFASGSLVNWDSDTTISPKSEPYSPSSSELHVRHPTVSPSNSIGSTGAYYDHLFSCAMDVLPLPCYKCAASLAIAGPDEILRSSYEERQVALQEYQVAQVAIQRCTALLNHYRIRLNNIKSQPGQYAANPQRYHEETIQCMGQVESGERELNHCRETCAKTKAALRRADRTLTMARRFCQISKEPRAQSHSLLLSDSKPPAKVSETTLRRW